jgi:hypothetical protein
VALDNLPRWQARLLGRVMSVLRMLRAQGKASELSKRTLESLGLSGPTPCVYCWAASRYMVDKEYCGHQSCKKQTYTTFFP